MQLDTCTPETYLAWARKNCGRPKKNSTLCDLVLLAPVSCLMHRSPALPLAKLWVPPPVAAAITLLTPSAPARHHRLHERLLWSAGRGGMRWSRGTPGDVGATSGGSHIASLGSGMHLRRRRGMRCTETRRAHRQQLGVVTQLSYCVNMREKRCANSMGACRCCQDVLQCLPSITRFLHQSVLVITRST